MRLGLSLSLTQSSPRSSGGEGDAPEWVPEGAKIHIDLVGGDPQARAWTEADGDVSVDVLLGEDTNVEGSWGAPTDYDQAKLTADGYTYADDEKVALIGAALTKLLAGATIVFRFKNGSSGVDGSFVLMSQPGQSKAVELDFNVGAATNGKLEAYAYSGSFGVLSDADQMNKGEGEVNGVGVTVVPASRFDYAANGRTAYPGEITTAEYPTSGAGEIICAVISLRNTYSLASITLYDALGSAAELPSLTS